MTLCWSLDKLGPMTRGVEDALLVLQAITGPDAGDPSSLPSRLDYDASAPVAGLKVGYFPKWMQEPPATDVDRAALETLRKLGLQPVEVTLPDWPHGSLMPILFAEAAASFEELTLSNRLDRPRRITLTYYVEWVLGATRDGAQAFVVPEFDPASETLLARNPWNEDFAGRVAFVAASQKLHGLTADRTEFLGRHGDYAAPAAMGRIGLASTVRAGLDPCAALHVALSIEQEGCRSAPQPQRRSAPSGRCEGQARAPRGSSVSKSARREFRRTGEASA